MQEGQVYASSKDVSDILSTLFVYRVGLCVGVLERGIFSPTHHAASICDTSGMHVLDRGDVDRYFDGDMLDISSSEAYLFVVTDYGISLGVCQRTEDGYQPLLAPKLQRK